MAQMLLCPSCRARVLEDWTSCKFCGEVLATSLVPVDVDPDTLMASQAQVDTNVPQAVPGALPPPPDDTYDWSHWVNDAGSTETPESQPDVFGPLIEEPVTASPPESVYAPEPPVQAGGDYSWAPPADDGGAIVGDPSPWAPTSAEAAPVSDTSPLPDSAVFVVPPGSSAPLPPLEPEVDFQPGAASYVDAPGGFAGTPDGTSEKSQALEPHPSESGGIWQAGPAPAGPPVDADDAGPSGLDPVSWYQEPEAGASEAFVAGPSLFGGVDELPDPPQQDFFSEPLIAPPAPPTPPGETLEQVGPRIEFTPAVDGWGTDGGAPSTSARGQSVLSHEARLIVMAILLVAVLAVTAYFVSSGGNSYPPNWTGNMGKLATTVSTSRGLEFKHPVGVTTLAPGNFAAALNSYRTVTDTKDKQLEADRVASFRALGVVAGDPTLTLPSAMLINPGDNAFYDLKEHLMVVRAGNATLRDNVAVVGALSVALDDQWGKLGSLTGVNADEQLTAVVAGSASLARSDYVDSLPVASRSEVQAAINSDATHNAPTLFTGVLESMRAVAGRALVQTLHDVKGNDGVNGLLQYPPTNDHQVSNPTAYFDGPSALQVPAPALPVNAALIGQGTLGATNMYLILASRLDPIASLNTSDQWAGDAFTRYRQPDGRVCISVAFRGAEANDAAAILAALQNWKAKLPDGQVKVTLGDADLVNVVACDPGASKSASVPSFAPAMALFDARSLLAANYFRAGTKKPNGPNGPLFTPTESWCMSDFVVRHVDIATLPAMVSEPGHFNEAATLDAGSSCGSTVADILFSPN